ncbi:hypothetical protein BpHYR1_033734 [Brachionus plicatilis]|uniref:Uncharacterized protein n=1 Tax=Brachionus plicatilis TaxID=10195 RepID=A0A3M7RMX1_BRAPC|nr:hypothetical protein BpHYR1_033734 [Brachionus plicatilis]
MMANILISQLCESIIENLQNCLTESLKIKQFLLDGYIDGKLKFMIKFFDSNKMILEESIRSQLEKKELCREFQIQSATKIRIHATLAFSIRNIFDYSKTSLRRWPTRRSPMLRAAILNSYGFPPSQPKINLKLDMLLNKRYLFICEERAN